MAELSIQQAMELFLKKSKLKQGIQGVRIEKIWLEIMGPTIAKYTDKIKISGDTLIISTTVAPLKNELIFQKETIIKKINEAFKEQVIKNISIR